MDLSSLGGLLLSFVAIGVGMILKGVSPVAIFVPAAWMIILVGTASAVTIATPNDELKKFGKLLGIIFKKQSLPQLTDIIPMFIEWATIARRDGLLALEVKASEIDDPFLKTGLMMAVDGQTEDAIREILGQKVSAMEARHKAGANIFTLGGSFAPTLGVLGAVLGLIAALANMNDIDKLGTAIGAAFIATLLGIYMGYVICHPFANKLKRKSAKEVEIREIMIEGILSIVAGQAPKIVEQKLGSYLTQTEYNKIVQKDGGN